MTRRFERRRRANIRLTERDFKVIEAVFEARYMTNRMIARLFYKPTTFSWCKQRLRYLFDLGYLRKRRVYMNEPDIYFLGLKGRRYVAVTYPEYTQEEVNKIAGVSGGDVEAPMLMMRHELTLSRLYVNARLEARELRLSFRWKNSRMLELMRLGIEPDAFLAVGYQGEERAAFIEFTSVLPTRREMRGKIERYDAYLESLRWQQDFGVDQIGVLWLTTSRNKAQHIWEAVWGARYRDYFLVGLIEDANEFLTKPMWRWSESEERVSWIVPPERVLYAQGGRA